MIRILPCARLGVQSQTDKELLVLPPQNRPSLVKRRLPWKRVRGTLPSTNNKGHPVSRSPRDLTHMHVWKDAGKERWKHRSWSIDRAQLISHIESRNGKHPLSIRNTANNCWSWGRMKIPRPAIGQFVPCWVRALSTQWTASKLSELSVMMASSASKP